MQKFVEFVDLYRANYNERKRKKSELEVQVALNFDLTQKLAQYKQLNDEAKVIIEDNLKQMNWAKERIAELESN